jgi:hypothetical protein
MFRFMTTRKLVRRETEESVENRKTTVRRGTIDLNATKQTDRNVHGPSPHSAWGVRHRFPHRAGRCKAPPERDGSTKTRCEDDSAICRQEI